MTFLESLHILFYTTQKEGNVRYCMAYAKVNNSYEKKLS